MDVGRSDVEVRDSDSESVDVGRRQGGPQTWGDGLSNVESRDSDVADWDFGTAQLGCCLISPMIKLDGVLSMGCRPTQGRGLTKGG